MTSARDIHYADYLVFGGMLIGTLAIGVYHAVIGARNESTSEYLLGGRNLNTIPVSISMMASFISAILLLGFPAETFQYGGLYWIHCVGNALGALLAVSVFVPVLYPLKLTSVNKYLMDRYRSKLLVVFGCVSSVSVMILYTGTVYYAPATAIEAITGFPTQWSIVVGSALTVIYTAIGGFKAVVWTDVFQAAIMTIGLVAVTVRGVMNVGSLSEVWHQCDQWERLHFSNWSPDPRERYTLWSLIFGVGINFMVVYGVTQTSVQRYSSLPTIVKARWCVFGVLPGTVLMISLASFSGLVIFAFYSYIGCDPLKAKFASNPNQLVPHFMLDTLNYPGLPGLFMAALCSGSLSSASSALNAAAANVWDDVLKEVWPNLSERKSVYVTKFLVVAFGIASTALAFAVSILGGTVIQSIITFSSAAGGPTAAMFLIGILFPFSNWKGAAVGGITGFVFSLWVAFGSYTIEQHREVLDSPTANCSEYAIKYLPNRHFNLTRLEEFTSSISFHEEYLTTSSMFSNASDASIPRGLRDLYSLSYLWVGFLGLSVAVVIGLVVSLISGGEEHEVSAKLLHPCTRRITGRQLEDEIEKKPDLSPTEEKGHDNPALEVGEGIAPYFPPMFESSV